MRQSQIEIRPVAGGIGAEVGNDSAMSMSARTSIKRRSTTFARPCSIIG